MLDAVVQRIDDAAIGLAHHVDARVGCLHVGQDVRGVVGRAVVHHDHPEIGEGLPLDAVDRLMHRRGPVIDGDQHVDRLGPAH